MFFTEHVLDMLIEYPKQTFRAIDSLEVPEATSIPRLPHDLGLRSIRSVHTFFLVIEGIYELSHNFLEII